MDIDKSISLAVIARGYRNASEFCMQTGFSHSKLSVLRKNNPKTTIGSIESLARAFDMSVHEFIGLTIAGAGIAHGGIDHAGWSDEGLPPLNVECEMRYKQSNPAHWRLCKVFAYRDTPTAVAALWYMTNARWKCATVEVDAYEFRPLETVAKKEGY